MPAVGRLMPSKIAWSAVSGTNYVLPTAKWAVFAVSGQRIRPLAALDRQTGRKRRRRWLFLSPEK